MPPPPSTAFVLAVAVTAPLPTAADTAPDCDVEVADGMPLLERQQRITALEALGPQCLKRLVVACTDAASQRLLDAGSAATCSMGYEALLRSRFEGDFAAMLAWWRERARDPDLD